MSSTFTSRKGNPKNKKKSIAQFQQEKQSISQPSCASAVRLQQELGTLSTADQRLIETIETAAFQQIRSGYSTKFDRFDAKVHRKDHKNAQELLQKALHFIDRQDYRQALKLLNEVSVNTSTFGFQIVANGLHLH